MAAATAQVHDVARETGHQVWGGVDTHRDTHTAAVLEGVGRELGTAQFPADARGYRALLAWLRTFGRVMVVGIEGTGA